jgi:hypothetical protein
MFKLSTGGRSNITLLLVAIRHPTYYMSSCKACLCVIFMLGHVQSFKSITFGPHDPVRGIIWWIQIELCHANNLKGLGGMPPPLWLLKSLFTDRFSGSQTWAFPI